MAAQPRAISELRIAAAGSKAFRQKCLSRVTAGGAMAEPDGTRSGLDYIVVPHVKQQPLYTVAARRPADNQSRHAALLRWSAGYNEDGTLRLAPDEAPKVIDNVDLERVLQGHTSDLFEYKILIQSVKQQRRAPEPYRPYASRQLPLGHRADVARNRGDSPYHVSSASERRYSGDGSVGDGAGRRQEGEGEEGEGGEGIDPEMIDQLIYTSDEDKVDHTSGAGGAGSAPTMGEAGGPSKRKREAGGQRGGEYGRDGGQVDRESVEAAGWEAEVADYLPPIPFEKPGRADKAGRREWNKRPSYVRKLMRFRERVASEYYETSDVRGVARSLRVLKTLFHLSTSLTHMSAELIKLGLQYPHLEEKASLIFVPPKMPSGKLVPEAERLVSMVQDSIIPGRVVSIEYFFDVILKRDELLEKEDLWYA